MLNILKSHSWPNTNQRVERDAHGKLAIDLKETRQNIDKEYYWSAAVNFIFENLPQVCL